MATLTGQQETLKIQIYYDATHGSEGSSNINQHAISVLSEGFRMTQLDSILAHARDAICASAEADRHDQEPGEHFKKNKPLARKDFLRTPVTSLALKVHRFYASRAF